MLPPSLTLFAVRVLSKTPHACFAAVPNAPAATAGCQAGGSCVADRSKRALRVGLTRSTHGRRTAGFGATPSLPRARRRSLHSSFADLHRRAMHAGGLLHGLRRGKPLTASPMEVRVTKVAIVLASSRCPWRDAGFVRTRRRCARPLFISSSLAPTYDFDSR